MWAASDVAEVKAVWGEGLGTCSAGTLRAALQALVDSGSEWPPTLPEFRELCRQYDRPEAASPALAAPRVDPPPGVAGALRDAVSGPGDPRFWAKHPKSAQAVRLLVRGCEREPSLRPILASLLRDPSPCRSDEARAELQAVAGYPPAWMREVA